MTWDKEADEKTLKTIEAGVKATEVIIDALRDLDKKKQLSPEFIPLYERFIPPPVE